MISFQNRLRAKTSKLSYFYLQLLWSVINVKFCKIFKTYYFHVFFQLQNHIISKTHYWQIVFFISKSYYLLCDGYFFTNSLFLHVAVKKHKIQIIYLFSNKMCKFRKKNHDELFIIFVINFSQLLHFCDRWISLIFT